MNYTAVVLNTPESGQQFAESTNNLANGTSVNVFGTPTQAQALAVENVNSKPIVLDYLE